MAEISQNCPHCQNRGKTPDTGNHMSINTTKKVYYCFRCNAKGKMGGPPRTGRIEQSEEKSLARQIDLKPIQYLEDPIQYETLLHRMNRRNSERIINYMNDRGLSACGHFWSGQLPGRVVFPITKGDTILFWTARSVSDQILPKYISSGKKSHFVYGLDEIEGDWAVLCEGPIDALSVPNGIAIFGKHPSDVQVRLISSRLKILYIALDGDADRSIIYKKFPRTIKLREVELNGDEDPNSVGREEMERRIREAGIRNVDRETWRSQKVSTIKIREIIACHAGK